MFGKMVKKTLKSNGIFQFCAILPLLNTNLFFTFWLCLHWFHMCYFYQEFHCRLLLLTLLFLSLFLALVERSHNRCMVKPVDVFSYYFIVSYTHLMSKKNHISTFIHFSFSFFFMSRSSSSFSTRTHKKCNLLRVSAMTRQKKCSSSRSLPKCTELFLPSFRVSGQLAS